VQSVNSNTSKPPKSKRSRAFTGLQDLERAFAEFEQTAGIPFVEPDSDWKWGNVVSSKQLDYARGLNDFKDLLPEGKFPPASQFLILCALQVYGSGAFELWTRLRDHYCRGKPRGTRPGADEALDGAYAIDAWLQTWLYNPLACPKPSNNSPADWIRCIGTTDPTPHLRMSHAFLRGLGVPLPKNYVTARRELLDIKGIFTKYTIVPAGSHGPHIESLLHRFPLIGWDIWQKYVYLLTSDIKPPSHFPIFGWRHQRVLDYVQHGRLLHTSEFERNGLGKPWSLHGTLWPQQIEAVRRLGPAHLAEDGPLRSLVGECCAV